MKNALGECKNCSGQQICKAENRKVRIDSYGRCLDRNAISERQPLCNICNKPVNVGEQLHPVANEPVSFEFSCECGISIKVPSTDRANAILMYSRIKREHEINGMLDVIKKAYRKHWLNDPDIGWDELGKEICDVLCVVMGEHEYIKFTEKRIW